MRVTTDDRSAGRTLEGERKNTETIVVVVVMQKGE